MTEKIRLVLMVDEIFRQALKSGAAERGMEMSELAEEIFTEALAEELQRIRRRLKKGGKDDE
jgi:hypothetical protein